mmetsp:Transcript_121736/g.344328  ORF Transcript_121736/g.344328 Transcript_121736/m.344328 type:complete len:517 (+) Transcript_121736:329-1879(+)
MNAKGTLSTKYFPLGWLAASENWTLEGLAFSFGSGVAFLPLPLPLPFGFLGSRPSPAQCPQPGSSSSLFASSSSFVLLSASTSASKSSSWAPCTNAVLTRLRCSSAASLSTVRALRTSSAVAAGPSPLSSLSAASSSPAVAFRRFFFLVALAAAFFVDFRFDGAAALVSAAPSAAWDMSAAATGASNHGFGGAAVRAACARAGAVDDDEVDCWPPTPTGWDIATGCAVGTPRTVSGPETVHSVAASPYSRIASTCLLASASSSGVNFLRLGFLLLSRGGNSGFPGPEASESDFAASSKPRSRPSSSFNTLNASFFASSRLRLMASRMKPMPKMPVVGSSPPSSKFLSPSTVSFLAFSIVRFLRLLSSPASASDPLRSTASDSSDWSGLLPCTARLSAFSSSRCTWACFEISFLAPASPFAKRCIVWAHFFLALRCRKSLICACFFSYSCFKVLANSGFSTWSLSRRASLSFLSDLRWMRRYAFDFIFFIRLVVCCSRSIRAFNFATWRVCCSSRMV